MDIMKLFSKSYIYIDDQLEAGIEIFIHMCLNHDNDICRSISLSKLLCKNSTFASSYNKYLSCKYNLSHHDWHLDTSHLIGKVRLKSLRSVQISILEPKNYPEVLRIDQYCEKNLDMLATKSFFSVKFGVTALPSLLLYR